MLVRVHQSGHEIVENLVRRRVESLWAQFDLAQIQERLAAKSNSEQRTPFSPSSEKGNDRPSPPVVDFCSWRGDESKRSITLSAQTYQDETFTFHLLWRVNRKLCQPISLIVI